MCVEKQFYVFLHGLLLFYLVTNKHAFVHTAQEIFGGRDFLGGATQTFTLEVQSTLDN